DMNLRNGQKPEARSQNKKGRSRFSFWLLASGSWLLFPLSAPAQQRPLITEDPRLISDGSLVTELGFAYLDRARFPLSGLEGNELSAFDPGLNFGLGPRAEFQMRWNAQNFPSPGGEDRGQVRLGFQVRAGGVRWDAAAVAGLTRRDPRAGVVFGVTKEFSLWK